MSPFSDHNKQIVGIPASPGIALGRAFLIDRRRIRTPKYRLEKGDADNEKARLDRAIKASEEQLDVIRNRILDKADIHEHLLIIEAHRLMLRDEMLLDEAKRLISEELINAEWAIRRTVRIIKRAFDSIDQEYFRERRGDVDFVGDRIIRNLMGHNVDIEETPPRDAVVVAHDLSPADTILLSRHRIAGIVTDVGGKTSHSAIVARALQIPAVVGAEKISELTGQGDSILIDGSRGKVVLWPSGRDLEEYRVERLRLKALDEEFLSERDLEAKTADGKVFYLHGNIEFDQEIDSVLSNGGEGIGLYRTEFMYIGKKELPAEEEQYNAYRRIVEKIAPKEVTIRTFDLGGDKVPHTGRKREPNPAMGLRAVRFSMQRPDIFLTQLRALLRAGIHGNLRIMCPLICGPLELQWAKSMLKKAMESLDEEGIEYSTDIPFGIMIELPSAVILADRLDADFFSVGTNDLIQYSLGIDRQNRDVAYLYRPLHLSVLRMLRMTADAAIGAGIPVSICGEMAGDPVNIPLLMAMGFDTFSMNSRAIPMVKRVIRAMNIPECRDLLDRAFNLTNVNEIELLMKHYMAEKFRNQSMQDLFI